MAQPQPLVVRAKQGVAPGRSPLGRGGPGRRDEAEPSLEVGAPLGPHLPLVAACVPLSHVARELPGGHRLPRSGVRGRGAAAVSGGRATARADPEPQPRHAARLASASGLRARLGRGLPALGPCRASLSPPLPPGLWTQSLPSSGRSPLGICA